MPSRAAQRRRNPAGTCADHARIELDTYRSGRPVDAPVDVVQAKAELQALAKTEPGAQQAHALLPRKGTLTPTKLAIGYRTG